MKPLRVILTLLFLSSIALGQSSSSGGPTSGAFISASPPGTGYQDVTEIVAPANPAAGVNRIYSDIVAHTIKCLTSGGGSCLTSGGSLPTATAKGQIPSSTGAGTTYAAQNKPLADEQDYTGATGCDIINNLAAANPFQKVSAEALTGSIYNCANVNLDNPFNTIQLNGGNIFTTDTGWTWGNRQVVNGNVGNIGATAVTSGTQFRASANFPLGSTPGTLTATGSSGAGTVSLTRTGTALQIAPYDTLVFAGDATIYYVKKCTAGTDPPCADTTGGGAGASDWYNLTGTITVNITPVLASSPSGAATTLTSAVVEFGDIQGGSPSGEKLESAFISCALATGNGIGVRDNYAQENSDARNVWINNCGRGFWVPSAANSGDWSNLNVGYTADANCTNPTIPFEVSGAHKKFSRATITTQSCTASKLTKGIFHVTNAQIGGVSAPGGLVLDQVHGEAQGPSNSVDMILVDSANPSPAGNTGAVEISGASGCPTGNPCQNLLHVASNFAGTLHLHDSTCNNGTTNAVVDDINANTMTCANNSIGLGEYRMDATGHIFTNLNSVNMTKGTNLYNGVLGFYTSNTLNASITEAGLITGKSVSLGSGPPSCGTGVTGAFCLGGASTAITPAVGMQGCQADSVTNVLQCSFNNLGLAPLFPSQGVNAQSGAGYTILLTEYGKLISVSNAGAQTVTLPATAPFNGWYVDIENTGAGTWTVSRNGLNIDGGTTNPSLTQNQGVRVLSNGSNYFTQRGIGGNGGVTSFSGDGALISNSGSTGAVTATLGAAAANTFFGNDTAGSTTPSYQKIGTSSTSVNWYIAGGGTAQAQTATLSPAARALTAGLVVHWLPTAANTAASPTLAVNGLTATAITKCGTAALIASDLTTTAIAEAFYDGTQFELLNPQARACGILAPVTNTTAVTVNNPTISTDTEMMELTLPTNYLNTVGQPFLIRAGGVFSTTAASAPQVTITAKLCSVSGCGSGTVTPLGAIQAGAASATAATNNSWAYDLVGAVNANGASCNLVVKGDPGLIIDLSNVASAADSIYADPNTGNSSPNQNCANSLFLGFFVQQSATGASNSYKQLIGAIMPTSGSGAGGGGTTSTQYAFWNPGGLAGTTAGTTAAANTTRLWGFSLPATITSSAGVCYYVATADNTANLYSISLYDHNGALIVSTGALAGTTLFPSTTFKCASWSAPTTVVGGDGNPTYFALTAGATGTAVIGENSSNMTFVAAVLAAGCTPSGGVACTPITPPTATWQAGQSANFGIHQ